jgi:hypothetical protein
MGNRSRGVRWTCIRSRIVRGFGLVSIGSSDSRAVHRHNNWICVRFMQRHCALQRERKSAMKRAILWILFCVVGMPCAAFAQSSQSSWQNLSTLRAGQKIKVIEKDATTKNTETVTGTFASVSETALTLQQKGLERMIQKQDVRTVKLMGNSHRLRNALIGGAVGAGGGAGVGAASWENRGFAGGKGIGAAVGAVIGFGVGAIVGALVPTHETVIYSATGQ